MGDNSSTLTKVGSWLEKGNGSRALGAAIVVLLVVSLLMPPISAWARISSLGYTPISYEGGSVSDPDGTQITFPADGVALPFEAKISSLPRVIFLAGTDVGKEMEKAAAAIPQNLVLKSPFYQISIRGKSPGKVVITVPIPNDSEPYETLDLYTWDGKEWKWLPSKLIREDEVLEARLDKPVSSVVVMQTPSQPMGVNLFVHSNASIPKEGKGTFAALLPLSYALKDDKGNIKETFSPESLTKQGGAGYSVLPVIRNWYDAGAVRTDLADNLLKQEKSQDTLIGAAVDLAVGNLYPGITLDFRNVDKRLRSEYTHFVERMAGKLHEAGKILVVRVDSPHQIAEDRFETGAYDWYAIGQAADLVQVPAPIDPTAYKRGGRLDQLMIWAVGHVPRQKLQVILAGRSVERAGNSFILHSYEEVTAPFMGQVEVDGKAKPGSRATVSLKPSNIVSPLQVDPEISQKWYSYKDASGEIRTIWIEDSASMAHKLGMISAYNVNGVTLSNLPSDALGGNAPLFAALQHFVRGNLGKSQIGDDLGVAFTVNGQNGQVAHGKASLEDPKFSFQIPKNALSLDIRASVVSGNQPLGTPVSVPMTIATPTPRPTPTPVATPTPTPPPYPVVVTNEAINLRSGPGTIYPRVGKTQPGLVYRIMGKNKQGSWWEIEMPGGKKAWISAKYSNASGNLNQVALEKEIPKPPVVRPAFARAPGFFGYGIQAHMVDNNQAPRVMQAVKDLGFGWVKQQVEWKRFEPNKGNYQWGPLDNLVNVANQYGVKVMLSVAKAPKWARPGNTDLSVEGPPSNPQDLADFMSALVRRYCGRVGAIEVWNEQNINYEWGNEPPDPARYISLLAASYRAIKAACPQMIVISGALTPAGDVTIGGQWRAVDDVNYLTAMYQHGLRNYCDAVGAHPSGFNVAPWVHGGAEACQFITQRNARFRGPCDSPHHSWSFRSTMEMYRNTMVRFGDSGKRIWPTEFGWASSPNPAPGYEYAADNSLQDQAEWTVKAYQMMKSWGWVGVAFLWNLNFKVVAPGSEMGQWGIVGRYWDPLPAYNALKAMPK